MDPARGRVSWISPIAKVLLRRQAGDVVQSIDGIEVRTLAGLLTEVDRRSVGDTIELQVMRNGNATKMNVRLEERPATVPAG